MSFILSFLILLVLTFPCSAFNLSLGQSMNFGTWLPTATSGSITLEANGTTNNINGLKPSTTRNIISPGIIRYDSKGQPSYANFGYLYLTNAPVQLTNQYGEIVSVNNLTPSYFIHHRSYGRYSNIGVGATLSFSSEPRGTYRGTLQIEAQNIISQKEQVSIPVSISFLKTISLIEQKQLDFGTIEVLGNSSGIIEINPSSGQRNIKSGNAITLNGSNYSSGKFLFKGEENTPVLITLSDSIQLNSSSGSSMLVDTFTKTPENNIFNNNGELSLNIGASLHIAPNQASGQYNGVYYINIDY